MPRRFDPLLVNDPFEDPGLYVDLVFEKRAMLFDIGDIAKLPTRKVLRISDLLITHRHMDHFAGFDRLLRLVLGREKTIGVFGPAGMIDAVDHKLRAYTWNLLDGYDGNVSFRVTELDPSGETRAAIFSGHDVFRRREAEASGNASGLLISEAAFELRAATLDHGVPVLAFALQERAQINIWRNTLEAAGLSVGPWLRMFKEAILAGARDDVAVPVLWRTPASDAPATLPLGQLKQEIMQVSKGRKLAYVVDCAYHRENAEKIIRLVEGADALFIEATFLDADAAIAAQRRHLTARQAGLLARAAHVKRLVTFHYSPRYRGEGERLAQEAQDAFLHG
ncbi:MAG: ribonuclease Z [Methylocystis sp.]|uniref:ribonuclease Z n=1 Tax=Methylocystis sp. TaxID=1911079 RepID=UPI003DA24BD7